MKKITMFLMAALFVATASMAQPGQKRVVQLPGTAKTVVKKDKSMAPRAEMQKQCQSAKSARGLLVNHQKAGLPKAPWQKKMAPQKIEGGKYITEQPAGEYVSYSRNGEAYAYNMMFGPMYTMVTSALGDVVFGDGGKVYIRNIISQPYPVSYSSWIEGKLEGSTMTFELPAKIAEYGGYYEMYAALMEYDAEEETYVYNPELTSFTLNYDAATRAITTPEDSPLATGEVMIGLMWGDDETWAGMGDWNLSFEVMNDEPVVVPDGLTTEQYSVVAEDFGGCLAQVGFSGNDVYVQGIYPTMPEAWIKGTINGDKVTFANGQYLGRDEVNGFHQYLMSANVKEIYDPEWDYSYEEYSFSDEDIVFDYDAATKILSNSNFFLVNAGTEEVYYAESYNNARIAPFTEVAATPAAPEWVELYEGGYSYYNAGWGWGYFNFDMITSDVDGNYILPEKISYAFYARVNGEEIPIHFSTNDYLYIDEDMTEIPFGYSDAFNYDISSSGINMYVYYYIIGPEAFGIQTIYRGAGEERRSEIAWQEVNDLGSEVQPEAATPEYPEVAADNVGESIDFSFYTGKEDVTVWGEYKAQTYDVAIRLNESALTGAHIDNIQIPLQGLADMKNVKVWLSSQLRIENGQNVPDLVSIDVTPTEEGFTVVELPKPYTIPAEGVYVGYSVTIDEVTTDDAAKPIVLCRGNKTDGLYLHTSEGFLKWLNMSWDMGLNSMIKVSVSGKDIYDNAAYAEDNDTHYVKVGEPIEQNLTFVNHGSKGIQSVDIELSLNGATTQQHIDLDEPVDGAYGLTSTQTVTLPALTERGNYELEVKVLKVNGEENIEAGAVSVTPLITLNTVPVHRTLMEEYTGTWCGYCVRGFTGLEKLAELYPDDFVCVSFHNGDPMEIIFQDEYPWNDYVLGSFPGFPSAAMDRVAEVDPFWGSNYGAKPMGIVDDLSERAKVFGQATIDMETAFDSDNDIVTVNTSVVFPYDVEDEGYEKFALEYLLIADGLTGEGSDWVQSNYYSGEYGEEACDELMPFIEAPDHVEGLVFNDVVVMISELGGIENSLPTGIAADEPIIHSYTFNLAEALSTSGNYVIQDKNKLRVVAMLINLQTGEVCNANKVKVGENTGITTMTDDMNNIRSIEYFDLGGRKLTRAQQGVSIMRINYNNGKQKSVKVLRK